jgi:hypothetical protein
MKTNGSEEGEQDNQYVFPTDILEMPEHLDTKCNSNFFASMRQVGLKLADQIG